MNRVRLGANGVNGAVDKESSRCAELRGVRPVSNEPGLEPDLLHQYQVFYAYNRTHRSRSRPLSHAQTPFWRKSLRGRPCCCSVLLLPLLLLCWGAAFHFGPPPPPPPTLAAACDLPAFLGYQLFRSFHPPPLGIPPACLMHQRLVHAAFSVPCKTVAAGAAACVVVGRPVRSVLAGRATSAADCFTRRSAARARDWLQFNSTQACLILLVLLLVQPPQARQVAQQLCASLALL
jgi:hypothetical protein